MALFLGLPLLLILVQLHAVEGFLPISPLPPPPPSSLLSFPSSFGIHDHGNHKHRNTHHYTALNLLSSKNLLADSNKLDITTEAGDATLYFMSEVASLSNIVVMPLALITYTMDERGRITNVEQTAIPPNTNSNMDDINEGRTYCMGDEGNPFEHMGFIANTISALSMAMSDYTNLKKLPLQWEQKLLSIEQSPSNPLGPCTIVKLLNDEDTVVLEVPLRTSYIVRNYSWMAQAKLFLRGKSALDTYIPLTEKDSAVQTFSSYGVLQMEENANSQLDSLSFIGATTKDLPDTINLPVTLVATWAGNSNFLTWGWSRAELMGLDAQSDIFSPRTMEYTHVFKDMDGDDPTQVSNNPIPACTLTKTLLCTSREASAFCQTAITNANAKSNDFAGLVIANVGIGYEFFTFKKSDYESLGINNSTASDINDSTALDINDSTASEMNDSTALDINDSTLEPYSTMIQDSNQMTIQQIVKIANTFNSEIRTMALPTQTLILIALMGRLQKVELLLMAYSISCGLP